MSTSRRTLPALFGMLLSAAIPLSAASAWAADDTTTSTPSATVPDTNAPATTHRSSHATRSHHTRTAHKKHTTTDQSS